MESEEDGIQNCHLDMIFGQISGYRRVVLAKNGWIFGKISISSKVEGKLFYSFMQTLPTQGQFSIRLSYWFCCGEY